MNFLIESAGEVASRTEIAGHTLVFDQSDPSYGGHDRGPSPLDVMVASIGACAHYYAAAYLRGRRLPVDELRVLVSGEKEAAPSPHIENLVLKVELPLGLRPEQERALERAVRRCPALGTVVHGSKVELSVSAPRSSASNDRCLEDAP